MMALSTNAVGNSMMSCAREIPGGYLNALFLVVLVWCFHGARRVRARSEHGDVTRLHPLSEIVAADAVVLHGQHARYGPLAVLGEADLADESVELVLVHVFRKLRLVE